MFAGSSARAAVCPPTSRPATRPTAISFNIVFIISPPISEANLLRALHSRSTRNPSANVLNAVPIKYFQSFLFYFKVPFTCQNIESPWMRQIDFERISDFAGRYPHNQNAIREKNRFVQFGCDEYSRKPVFFEQLDVILLHQLPCHDIQAPERFIQDHDLGAVDQGLRQLCAPLHPA